MVGLPCCMSTTEPNGCQLIDTQEVFVNCDMHVSSLSRAANPWHARATLDPKKVPMPMPMPMRRPHRFSTYPIVPLLISSQPTLSTHHLNTPSHTPSHPPSRTPSQPTLSHTLSTHLLNHPSPLTRRLLEDGDLTRYYRNGLSK